MECEMVLDLLEDRSNKIAHSFGLLGRICMDLKCWSTECIEVRSIRVIPNVTMHDRYFEDDRRAWRPDIAYVVVDAKT